MDRRLNGLNPLAYLGVDPYTPPELVIIPRPPTQNDLANFYLGTIWIDNGTNNPPTANNVWLLVAALGNIATWINFGGAGDLLSLTGDVGGPVFGDPAHNIDLIGDAGLEVIGDPATHSLVITSTGGGQFLQSLTGDAGGPVQPDNTGNINTPGAHGINTLGNPGAHSMTFAINNAITLGDLVALGANVGALTAATGDVIITAGDLTLPNTNAAGNQGIVKFGGNRWISNYGTNNTFVGQVAGNTTLTAGSSTDNTAIGFNSLNSLTLTAVGNTSVGSSSLSSIGAGQSNSALGYSTGSAYTSTESYNTVIGYNNLGVVGEGATTRIGAYGPNNAITTNNTFVGYNAGNTTYTLTNAIGNTFIGTFTGYQGTTGGGCTFVGSAAGITNTTGSNNVAVGTNAMGASLVAGVTTGSNNTSLGTVSLWNILGGSRNTALGYGSGSHLTGGENDNIYINSLGTSGDANTLVIGQATGNGGFELNRSFISGIRGITTGNADAIAVLIDSAGQLGTVSSSARYKENIKDMGTSSDPIMNLRPVTFTYIRHQGKYIQFGLIAEEVEKVFPELIALGMDGLPESVKYHELPVLLLNEIQKLSKRIEELEKVVSKSQ